MSHLCWRGPNPNDNAQISNGFIACTDESIQLFHVSYSVDHDSETDVQKQTIDLNHFQTIQCHPKVVNMCTMLDYNRVITCSRDPVIKLWNVTGGGEEAEGEPEAKFTGHEMSVSTVAVSTNKEKLASGGRDCTTRIWDVESQKSISKR